MKLFHWLADLDRCWTAERLARRGLQHHAACLLCDQEFETLQHLFCGCTFSRQVWHEILASLRMPCAAPDGSTTLLSWWQKTKPITPKPMRKGLTTATLLIPWMVWKKRNFCVFDGDQPAVQTCITTIKQEAYLLARAGALGLRAILPQNQGCPLMFYFTRAVSLIGGCN